MFGWKGVKQGKGWLEEVLEFTQNIEKVEKTCKKNYCEK